MNGSPIHPSAVRARGLLGTSRFAAMPPRFPVRRLVRLSERIPTGGESIPLAEGRPPKATWAGGVSAAPEAEQDHSTVPVEGDLRCYALMTHPKPRLCN